MSAEVYFSLIFPQKKQANDPADQYCPGIGKHTEHKKAPTLQNRMEMIQFRAKYVNSPS